MTLFFSFKFKPTLSKLNSPSMQLTHEETEKQKLIRKYNLVLISYVDDSK